jgi:predicted TPR repeat methyltransferase
MSAPLQRSSGDLRADRRYAYARAALEERDASAAADLFRQTLELAPDWPPAHFGLGEALELSGEHAAAIAAFRRALALQPDDALGAAVRLARLGDIPEDGAMRPGYVAALFDEYADRFDAHLVEALAYRGPEIVAAAIAGVCAAAGRDRRFGRALDIGCGTGLMAGAVQGWVDALEGVDLSPGMIGKARRTDFYAEGGLTAGDALAHLAAQPDGRYDLLMAADVMVYMGDLGPILREAARVMAARGLFAFTVQMHDGDGFALGPDLRYRHGGPYIRGLAAASCLTVAHLSPCVTRQDGGRDVPGLVAVLAKPHG